MDGSLKAILDQAIAAHNAKRDVQAEQLYQRVLQQAPDNDEALVRLGLLYQETGRQRPAAEAFEKAIGINPNRADYFFHISASLRDLRRSADAMNAIQQSLRLNPRNSQAWNRLGSLHHARAEVEPAIAALEKAIELQPDYAEAHSNLMLCMQYIHGDDGPRMFEAHLKSANQLYPSPTPPRPPRSAAAKSRPIRIGYISADFREHAVSYFFESVLAHHDRSKFEVYLISNSGTEDAVTKRLRSYPGQWINVFNMSDADAAKIIREREIDILIDLSGRTAGNRLGILALRPAPLQGTYLGYPGTTGLKAADFRITDAISDPPGEAEALHTEKLIRLPHGFLCYRPHPQSPPVQPLPAIIAGQITFCSFNAALKISDDTLRLWTAVLKAVPGSRLLLKSHWLGEPVVQQRIRDYFLSQGFEKSRIGTANETPRFVDHLDVYRMADIALDCFPYNGTTTTVEALWMGVPVITLMGKTHVTRVSGAILNHIGLPELVAKTTDQFAQIAANLAGNLGRLVELRTTMRQRMTASALVDGPRFMQDFESALIGALNEVA